MPPSPSPTPAAPPHPFAPRIVAAGAILGGLSVLLGAFGAHDLRSRLSPSELETWTTGVRYLQVHALAVVAAGLFEPSFPRARRLRNGAAVVMVSACLLFAGSLMGRAVGAPRWLGAVAPVGGLGLVVAWLGLAASALAAYRFGRSAPESTPPRG